MALSSYSDMVKGQTSMRLAGRVYLYFTGIGLILFLIVAVRNYTLDSCHPSHNQADYSCCHRHQVQDIKALSKTGLYVQKYACRHWNFYSNCLSSVASQLSCCECSRNLA